MTFDGKKIKTESISRNKGLEILQERRCLRQRVWRRVENKPIFVDSFKSLPAGL